MTEDEKKELNTDEAMREFVLSSPIDEKEDIDRFVDLLIDLIAERSEEKAEEVLEAHKLDYDHDRLY